MKKKAPPHDGPEGPFNAAFASLRARVPERPGTPSPGSGAAAEAPKAPKAQALPPAPARAVVRLERKGRGGKEATIVEKLALPPAALAGWTDALKRALGCGGVVEGDRILLQGDQRERVRGWLEGRGVRKVTVA
jgi:translation initiation factor 1